MAGAAQTMQTQQEDARYCGGERHSLCLRCPSAVHWPPSSQAAPANAVPSNGPFLPSCVMACRLKAEAALSATNAEHALALQQLQQHLEGRVKELEAALSTARQDHHRQQEEQETHWDQRMRAQADAQEQRAAAAAAVCQQQHVVALQAAARQREEAERRLEECLAALQAEAGAARAAERNLQAAVQRLQGECGQLRAEGERLRLEQQAQVQEAREALAAAQQVTVRAGSQAVHVFHEQPRIVVVNRPVRGEMGAATAQHLR
jgi:hypothetical protein